MEGRNALDILRNGVRYNLKQYSMFIALLGIIILFTIITGGGFLKPGNLANLLMQISYIAILAVGMVLVIVAGHIDLSVGFLAGTCGGIAALLNVYGHWPMIPSIAVALAAGAVVGIWQGYWVAFRGVPAFIVTLAGMLIFKGTIQLVTGGKSIAPLSKDFEALGNGYIPQLFLKGEVGTQVPFHDTSLIFAIIVVLVYLAFELRARGNRKRLGFDVLPMSLQIAKIVGIVTLIMAFFSISILTNGMPYAVVILLGLVLIFSFITQKTVFGRHVYAIGGNKDAARLSGINIKSRTMSVFVIMGTLSALAGVVFTARSNSATASAGTLFELDAIAAAIIGGTSTLGGEGTILGAMIGALVMATLSNGMQYMNVPTEVQYLIKGMILLLAVWFDIASRKKKN